MVSIFVEKENEQATLDLYKVLEGLDLPPEVNITINNMEDGKSGLLCKDDSVIDISLASCYTLEDVVQELVALLVKKQT